MFPNRYPIAATPKPTINISNPLRIIPLPVKMLLDAPTPKCESINIIIDAHIAACPFNIKKGSTGMNEPIAVASPVIHPSLNGLE